ncbi:MULTISPECIES: class I SAM-dependent methyltransferase [Alphaproteobacteria]|uniref:class I SAM-dependent methyltransferase n=1 Tax=Alphaproteobacteria TaxID=28211 RepID=UPI003A9251E6
MTLNEKNHLENIAQNSLYGAGANEKTVKYSFNIAQRYLTGTTLLEMGPAEGIMTELLAKTDKKLTLLEGSAHFCKDLKSRFPNAEVVHALFEEFRPADGITYDNIILGHVLEHVEDPVSILRNTKDWLTPNTGMLFAAVPNARSLHRQAAVLMGLLGSEHELNEMDHHHGHRRVFNPENFRKAFNDAGMTIDIFGGYWMKPVSNKQIETTWTDEMLQAFMVLGERYPDISGEIYIVARNKQ